MLHLTKLFVQNHCVKYKFYCFYPILKENLPRRNNSMFTAKLEKENGYSFFGISKDMEKDIHQQQNLFSSILKQNLQKRNYSIFTAETHRPKYDSGTRGFRSKKENENWYSFFTKNKDQNLEKVIHKEPMQEEDIGKLMFAEGYFAGKNYTNPPKYRWGLFIGTLFLGLVVGFLLPIFTFSEVKVDLDKEILLDLKKVKTTFRDVKGIDEAKRELQEIVQFLKSPRKFEVLGGKLPKGVLLVGPPGTGKTLLARALAGEAGVPYFHISGSEFEQTYVGEGARRVRELFKVAKKYSPCVIFIDEIDSVGSKRINSPMHPHSNQTINQLLTEMDGFSKNEGVIVLAATNRKEDLDHALLRPGRFDLHVSISPPNFLGRIEILEHFLQEITNEKVDVEVLARGTVGFTGADIENMINRAAIKAAIDGAPFVTHHHLLKERDRILMGPENFSRIPDSNANQITAFHEGGHCVVAYHTPHSQPLHKVTIIPRGSSLGHTAFLPEKDEVYISKEQILARIDSLLGGRAAEELVFGHNSITSGAANDLEVATKLARRMVTKWGMSEVLGLRTVDESEVGPISKDEIEKEVNKILMESYERAKNVIRKYSLEHAKLAQALLDNETLEADEIKSIMTGKKI